MGKYEALEKLINDEEYDKVLMNKMEEYYKPAWGEDVVC